MRYLLTLLLAPTLVVPPARQEPESIATVAATIDVTCILRSWRIAGVDACIRNGRPHVCLVIENAYPVGILEAVRKPFASRLAETALLFEPLRALAKTANFTSSHTSDTASGTGLQFSEAHAYEFVPHVPVLSEALPLAIPRGNLFAISYLSELDAFHWRSGLADLLTDPEAAAQKAALPACSVLPRTEDCAWSWGTYFPRTGFAIHPSEVMAAHLLALRGGRVGSRPTGRIVVSPYPYEPRTGHYIRKNGNGHATQDPSEAILREPERHRLLRSAESFLPELGPERTSTLLWGVARLYLSWVDDLPASENHHHAGPFGLFDHSLAAADRALRAAISEPFREDTKGYPEEEHRRLPRLRYAAWLLGLTHDAGKAAGVRVLAQEGAQWNPFREPLSRFYARHGREACRLDWRGGRGERSSAR